MTLWIPPVRLAAAGMLATLLVVGCSSQQRRGDEAPVADTGPDYSRPLPEGASALRRIDDPARLPDLAAAFENGDALLQRAIDHSRTWFTKPSSKQWYPFEGITHEQAEASLAALQELIDTAPNGAAFERAVIQQFDVYESIGCDDEGTVLFTGYYAGRFDASDRRTAQFKYPLYARPDDLVTDANTGQPRGRRTSSGSVVPYYTRAEIESSGRLDGTEIAWLEDPLSVYIVHVNGSARLDMTDGSVRYVGYAGKTDRPYKGLGQAALDSGLLSRNELSLRRIKQIYQQKPEIIEDLIDQNESYVFFTDYPEGNWPAGSLGVRVTAESSLATDKRIYPRGGVVLVDTEAVTFSQGRRDFLRLMVDQDTGGAIRAPGRADIYMGDGLSAEILAGGQYAEGRLYYLFLKPEYVDEYRLDEHELRRVIAD